MAVMGLEPAPQPARHHGEHHVVDGRAVGGRRDLAQIAEPGRGEGQRAPAVDVPVERRPQPRLRCLPHRGQQPVEPVMLRGRGASRRRCRTAFACRSCADRECARRPAPMAGEYAGGGALRGLLVPQHRARHAHRRQAVRKGVVDPPDQRAAAAGNPGYHVHPPQRP